MTPLFHWGRGAILLESTCCFFSTIFSALLICKPLRDFSHSLSVSSPGPCSWLMLPFFLHFFCLLFYSLRVKFEKLFFPFSPMPMKGKMWTADWQCYACHSHPQKGVCVYVRVCVSVSVALSDRLNWSAGGGCLLNFRECSSWHLDSNMCILSYRWDKLIYHISVWKW